MLENLKLEVTFSSSFLRRIDTESRMKPKLELSTQIQTAGIQKVATIIGIERKDCNLFASQYLKRLDISYSTISTWFL